MDRLRDHCGEFHWMYRLLFFRSEREDGELPECNLFLRHGSRDGCAYYYLLFWRTLIVSLYTILIPIVLIVGFLFYIRAPMRVGVIMALIGLLFIALGQLLR
jgi:hypothetical protein